jgi:hypothetical protein
MKLAGNTDIEDSLQRLDKLTQEEARMASAELLKITHGVDDRVKGVEGKVQDVRSDVQVVGNKVQGVNDRVQDIGNDVRDRLDQANRSSSLKDLFVIPRAQTASQGTSSEIVFYDGFRPRIRPSIITLPPKLIMTVQLSGFFKAVYLISGNPLTPFCGYMENVG